MRFSNPEDIKLLLKLGNDGFLTAFNDCLKLLKSKPNIGKCPMYHVVETRKDESTLAAEALSNLLETSIQESTTPEQLKTTLAQHGFQEDKISLFVSQLDSLKVLISKRDMQLDTRDELIDLQWKFGVVAGSSVKEETGRTFVQVKLLSQSPEGSTSSRHIEMSLEKFYDFLHQLEKAKASLDYINYL